MTTPTDITAGECVLWTGTITDDGYGRMPDHRYAHRVAYEDASGPIPSGLQLDHLCRNRACVNPAHLEVVTSRENTLRGIGPTAQNARKTHCKHGHELTPANTYRWRVSRICKTCSREAHANWMARLRSTPEGMAELRASWARGNRRRPNV